MALRRTYTRPMAGWWRRNPYFLLYLAREATALFVVAYAVILLAGVIRLSQGRAAFEDWLEGLSSPGSVAFHVVLLAAMIFHTCSWFAIMPKTMPPLVVGGRPVAARAITAFGIAASVLACGAFFVLVRSLA